MVIEPYLDSSASEWDSFVRTCPSASFLHTRRFLSYHGNKFIDQSLIVRDSDRDIVALFPAALSPIDSTVITSHPGITYGGLLTTERCRGEAMVRLFTVIAGYYSALGIRRILYKAVPYFYHWAPCQDDLYALFRLGANRYRCDLSSTIDLERRGKIGSRRKRGLRRALMSEVRVTKGLDGVAKLWDVLSKNLEKHNAEPVHSLDEIILLHERFPKEIEFITALVDGEVESGLVLFKTETVTHAQYIASSTVGYAMNALDLIFESAIAEAASLGVRYFDFGISNENNGTFLNEGLYAFKSEFGAGGCVHEFYEIDLVKL